MKIFVVIKVARQLQGEYVMVQSLAAFKEASKAEVLAKQHSKGNEIVPTPNGNMECFCEVGIHELEVEE